MKSLILFLLLATLCVASPPRFLGVSPECSNHGVFYNNQCFCSPNWLGQICSFYDYTGSNEVIRIRSPPPPSAPPCENGCSGNGVCDTATGRCACNKGSTGSDCSEFDTSLAFKIVNAATGKSMAKDSASKIILNDLNEGFKFLPTKQIQYVKDETVLNIFSKSEGLVGYWRRNVPFSRNQQWNVVGSNGKYYIQVYVDPSSVLASDATGEKVALVPKVADDLHQIWSIVPI